MRIMTFNMLQPRLHPFEREIAERKNSIVHRENYAFCIVE